MDQRTFRRIFKEAESYLGKKYVWGGTNPRDGFDCSGFTQWVFNRVGISLPRTAQKQYLVCTRISKKNGRPGDLVFFKNTRKSNRSITHVGIYLGNHIMLNCNRKCGIGFTRIQLDYWKNRFVSFGRAR